MPESRHCTGIEGISVPFRSRTRVLLISGTLDSNTPPFQAEQVLAGLPNGESVVVKNEFHEALISSAVQALVVGFFDGGDVSNKTVEFSPPGFAEINETATPKPMSQGSISIFAPQGELNECTIANSLIDSAHESPDRRVAYAALGVGTGLRLDADVVIHSSANTLLASEVSFRRLDRNVPEQELDLFQLSTRGMPELRAGAPQVMWRDLGQTDCFCILLYHVPNHSLGYPFAPSFAGPADASEQSPSRNSS